MLVLVLIIVVSTNAEQGERNEPRYFPAGNRREEPVVGHVNVH